MWLVDKVYNFSWNSAEPQKFRRRRGAWYKISAEAASGGGAVVYFDITKLSLGCYVALFT